MLNYTVNIVQTHCCMCQMESSGFPQFYRGCQTDRGEDLGFFYFLVSQLTLCEKKKKSPVVIFPVAFFHCAHLRFFQEFLSIPLGSDSSTLAWRIPGREEPGGLQSMGSLRVGHDRAPSLSLFTFMHWRRKWQPTPVFLPGESQGWGSLVGCRLWGRTELDRTGAT